MKLRRLLALTLLTGILAAACSQQPGGARRGADMEDRGAQIYLQNCVPCHKENGAGVRKVYPSLAGSPAVLGDAGELARWILSQKRPDSIPAGRYPTQMLAFGWMKDADVASLLTYIRSSFGNAAPPVDAATIAQAR
jgi:alcohol dehydrogenase (quinone), cytochrome c subunit